MKNYTVLMIIKNTFAPVSHNVLGWQWSSTLFLPDTPTNCFSQRSFQRVCGGLECGWSAFYESFFFESL